MKNIDGALALVSEGEALGSRVDLNAKHLRLLGRLREILKKKGKRLNPSRECLARLFLSTEEHSRLDTLLDGLRLEFPEASMSLVKSTMNLLVESGVARSFLVGEEIVFEHGHLSEHHDHLICVKCGAIHEFFDEHIEEHKEEAARLVGFQPFFHRLTIHGLCAACFESSPFWVPLSEAKPGERYRVESIEGDPAMLLHLSARGLARGAEIEVVGEKGAMAVEVRGSRVAVGAQMAGNILLSALSGAEVPAS